MLLVNVTKGRSIEENADLAGASERWGAMVGWWGWSCQDAKMPREGVSINRWNGAEILPQADSSVSLRHPHFQCLPFSFQTISHHSSPLLYGGAKWVVLSNSYYHRRIPIAGRDI